MGSWGTGPMDNDAAADWVYGLDKVMVATARAAGRSEKTVEPEVIEAYVFAALNRTDSLSFPEEVRAAVSVLMGETPGYVPSTELLEQLIEAMWATLQNKEWLGDWDEPDTVRELIEEEISRLEDLRGPGFVFVKQPLVGVRRVDF